MTSIRTYKGEIRVCMACGQPCHHETVVGGHDGWVHFDEQWDGIYCPQHPFADGAIRIDWDEQSLEDLKDRYTG